MEVQFAYLALAVMLLIIVWSNVRASQEIFSAVFIIIITVTLVGVAFNGVTFEVNDINQTAELKQSITIRFN